MELEDFHVKGVSDEKSCSGLVTGTLLCVLCALAILLSVACGGESNGGNADSHSKAESTLREHYQKLLASYGEYEVKEAVLADALTKSYYAQDSLEISSIEEDRGVMRTILNTCYEIAHRPNNFSRDHLRKSADRVDAEMEQYRKAVPLGEVPASVEGEATEFRKARDKYLDSWSQFGGALSDYLDSTK